MPAIITKENWSNDEDLHINLYLSYVEHSNKNYGYVFIIELYNSNLDEYSHKWLCIEDNATPTTLDTKNIDYPVIKQCYDKLLEVIKEQNTDLSPHMQNTLETEYKELFIDVFGELTYNLRENYETTNYSHIKQDYHSFIKKYMLEPVQFFNKYAGKELKGTKEDMELVKKQVHELTETFNRLPDSKRRNDLFNELIKGIELNPLLKLRYGNYSKEKPIRLSAVPIVIKELGIKKTIDTGKNGEKSYIYDKDLTYYVPIDKNTIKPYFYKTYDYILDVDDYNKILSNNPHGESKKDNIYVFENILYDAWNLCDLQDIAGDYERRDYFTTNLIGNDNNSQREFHLLNYDTSLTYNDIFTFKDIENDNMTLIERTLRQILIPKNNPMDLSLFIDYLERLGSCIRGVNEYKTITMYYGDGDNGKSILKLLMELVYNNKAYSLRPKDLEGNFNLTMFQDRAVLIIDEILKTSFQKVLDELKRMSSALSSVEERAMYSADGIKLRGYSNLFIMTNDLMDIGMEQLAIFSRLDILDLPNKFVDAELLNNYTNAYPLIDSLENRLREDLQGLSWLITASLICFKKMKNEGRKYIKHQNTIETMRKYTHTDELLAFLQIFTEYDENIKTEDYITNKEIISRFKEYVKNEKIPYTAELLDNDRKIGQHIGMKLSKLYSNNHPDYYYKPATQTYYKLRLRTFEEVEKENNKAFIINEHATAEDFDFLNNNTELKTVYKHISKGTNTINQLKKELGAYNVKSLIQTLEMRGLITTNNDANLDTFKDD